MIKFFKTTAALMLSLMLMLLCSCSILEGEPAIISDEQAALLTKPSADEETVVYSSSTAITPVNNNGVWTINYPSAPAQRLEDGSLKSFETLRQLNPDIAGWITIPGTVIDYPVVKGADNDFYLHHNIYGEENKNGTLFIHYKNRIEPDYQSPVLIIFGHHMHSGVMFEDLMQYDITSNPDALEFYRNSGVFTYNGLYDEGAWVIYSVMKLNTLDEHGPVFRFMVSDFTEEQTAEYQAYIDETRARSVIDTSEVIDVTVNDRIMVMSTCSYEYDNFRTIIVARKLRSDETSLDLNKAKKAENPVMPEIWDITY